MGDRLPLCGRMGDNLQLRFRMGDRLPLCYRMSDLLMHFQLLGSNPEPPAARPVALLETFRTNWSELFNLEINLTHSANNEGTCKWDNSRRVNWVVYRILNAKCNLNNYLEKYHCHSEYIWWERWENDTLSVALACLVCCGFRTLNKLNGSFHSCCWTLLKPWCSFPFA